MGLTKGQQSKNNNWGRGSCRPTLCFFFRGMLEAGGPYQASTLGYNQGVHVGGHVWFTSGFFADIGFVPPLHPSPCSRIRKPCLVSQGADF